VEIRAMQSRWADIPKRRLLGYRWPIPVGQLITRDLHGRVINSEPIEGTVITASSHPK